MKMTKTDQIAQEIESLRRPDGLILAEEIVEWAREHPESALHSQFEWDDSEAAKNYRLWQARRVIAVYVMADDGGRKLVSLTIDRKSGGYRDVKDVIADDELRKVLIRDALDELRRVRAKYERLKELAAVFAEVEKVERTYAPGQSQQASAA
jgi:hypothetical protein